MKPRKATYVLQIAGSCRIHSARRDMVRCLNVEELSWFAAAFLNHGA